MTTNGIYVDYKARCDKREARKQSLKQKSKREVFEIYVRTCCGRIHCADIREMRKGWMIDDILAAEA